MGKLGQCSCIIIPSSYSSSFRLSFLDVQESDKQQRMDQGQNPPPPAAAVSSCPTIMTSSAASVGGGGSQPPPPPARAREEEEELEAAAAVAACSSAVKVVVRVRPMSGGEVLEGARSCVLVEECDLPQQVGVPQPKYLAYSPLTYNLTGIIHTRAQWHGHCP